MKQTRFHFDTQASDSGGGNENTAPEQAAQTTEAAGATTEGKDGKDDADEGDDDE
jgi:hypothetical protein